MFRMKRETEIITCDCEGAMAAFPKFGISLSAQTRF